MPISLAQLIEAYRQDNNRSNDHLLPVRIGSQKVAAVGQQSHDERSDQGAQYAALAASQAAADPLAAPDDKPAVQRPGDAIERWNKMSPEEREKFSKGMRCGRAPFASTVEPQV